MRTVRFAPGAVIVALAALVLALPVAGAFDIIDSGLQAVNDAHEDVHWLDDEQVLFRAPPAPDESPQPALVLWKVGGSSRVIRRRVSFACTQPGFLAYRAVVGPSSRDTALFAGGLGSERELAKDEFDMRWCAMRREAGPPDPRLVLARLRPGDGYINPFWDKAGQPGVAYYAAKDAVPVPMPFSSTEMASPRYFPWRGAYYIATRYVPPGRSYSTNVWPPGTTMPAYWLTPGGALETLHLPPDVGLYANPTRAGLVYRERDKEWRHHVMLYTPEGKRVEISSTDAREPAVSPSGCRIAFASAPDARSGTRRTLQVADLCRPRGEQ